MGSSKAMSAENNSVNVSGIGIQWNVETGECAFEKLPVAMLWIDTTLAGLFSGVQSMVGTQRYLLALQSEGRKSVADDWNVISQFPDFRDGFKAIANIAAVAGWGRWELASLDYENKEARFKIRNVWEGAYQKSLGVCWGSGFLAGKLSGYCSKLFQTNCWADQTSYIAKGDECDEFVVHPSNRSIEEELKNLLATDNATRADMAVAMRALEKEVAERMITEKMLRENEQRLKTILDTVADPIYVKDSDHRIILANPAFCEIFSMNESDVAGKTLAEHFPPEERESFLAVDRLVLDTGESDMREETLTVNGVTKVVIARKTRLVNDSGERFLVGSIHDITELKSAAEEAKKLQAQLYHSQKLEAMGQLAAGMAHDFNNILGIIMGNSDILMSQDFPPDVKKKIESILMCSQRGRELTRNLLQFAQDRDPKITRIDLTKKIKTLIQSLQVDLKNVEATTDFGQGANYIYADIGMLENALINMIKNSIHAMSKTEKPALTLRTLAEDKYIVIEIEDNGCGIPAEYQHKIYDPTFTLKGREDKLGAYRPGIKGNGYGMANVKKFVSAHEGVIELESESGKGSRFKIKLPSTNAAALSEEIFTNYQHGKPEGKRILLIEDETELAEILSSILKKAGYRADIAENGETALDYFERIEYDAVSLDYLLPDMNGFTIYRKMREKSKEIPIVFVSGNFEFMQSMIDLKNEDPKADHLAKPFKNSEYIEKMRKWVSTAGHKANERS